MSVTITDQSTPDYGWYGYHVDFTLKSGQRIRYVIEKMDLSEMFISGLQFFLAYQKDEVYLSLGPPNRRLKLVRGNETYYVTGKSINDEIEEDEAMEMCEKLVELTYDQGFPEEN